MSKPDLSIIIVSYNTKKITKDCIESIFKSSKNSKLKYEIIIVDNNSKDGSTELFQEYKEKYKDIFQIFLNHENLGFGKGNNLGVNHARGNYILLLNSDAFAQKHSVEKLLSFYKNHESEVQFVGGKLLNPDFSNQPSAAPFFTLLVTFAVLFLRGDYWGLTRYSPNKPKRVDWVAGACILTKKKYYEELHGFDEGVFMYMEEVDLLYRAGQKGYATWFYPDARFIHIGFASSGSKSYPVIQVFRGLLYFYKKHYSRFALFALRFMLKLKAVISISIGRITKNDYLTETYEKAYQLVKTESDSVKVD